MIESMGEFFLIFFILKYIEQMDGTTILLVEVLSSHLVLLETPPVAFTVLAALKLS